MKQMTSRIPRKSLKFITLVLLSFCLAFYLYIPQLGPPNSVTTLDTRRQTIVEKCKFTQTPAGPPPNHHPSSRIISGSDRFVPGTSPTLIRNAKILTGARHGTEVIFGDILLSKGLVAGMGYIPSSLVDEVEKEGGELAVVDAKGKWATPGLVDLHSHLGVSSAPGLRGASDGNSHKAPILPWLRSIDGLNTHDDAYALSIAGGVTTAQILPGSANNIGGQAVLIKLRPVADRSVSSRVLEPPRGMFINTTESYVHWRHMKHACGENPDRLYSQSRMDAAWNFRHAYNEAKKIKEAQDEFCSNVGAAQISGNWDAVDNFVFSNEESYSRGEFPESLQWESLVDVLRGKVKLSIHCYEAVDLDMIVRLSNEFKFPVASFHHAGETYLVPDLLKKTWGGAPSIALFASNARKKREAYRASEFGPSILAQHGIPVVMKSDHPVLNSRYLMYETQQAFYYGLHPALAIAAVTSMPAKAAGVGHRVGTLALGYDADVVLWDSHPLALGATPEQVWIDGIAQLSSPHVLSKPPTFQDVPITPDWDYERNETVRWDGVPPLRPRKRIEGLVKFTNVKSMWTRQRNGRDIDAVITAQSTTSWTVVAFNGLITCISETDSCITTSSPVQVIDLAGGGIAPGLTSFGSNLGINEILLEQSTNDGVVFDSLSAELPSILETTTVRAIDGLQLNGRNLLLAYRSGVTKAVTAPLGYGFSRGVGTAFRAGAVSPLEHGAIIKAETALHINLTPNMEASVSTQIALLRTSLFNKKPANKHWERVREGRLPLVIHVDSADIMATLIVLKSEYESLNGKNLSMTFAGGSEAHLIAQDLAQARISILLLPSRPFPASWDRRRILPGPPLSKDSALTVLLSKGVNVGIGVEDEFDAKNARFDMIWLALESDGRIGEVEALALFTTNVEKALGVTISDEQDDLVLYHGASLFNMSSKVIGSLSGSTGAVELF